MMLGRMQETFAKSLAIAPGVTLLDTGFVRPERAASYIVRGKNGVAFVDSGTALSVPRLLDGLAAIGVARRDVTHVIVTHVHLDHAGGAGALLGELPNARLVVHPRGARHMIDPSKLIAGSTAVYGAELLARLFGTMVPVPAERVIEAADGFTLDLGERPLVFWDAPGHALHHVVVFDEATQGFFTGDTFGLAYHEFDTANGPFVFPTTTPVQFDPAALHASINRMLTRHPQRMYLTHYGMLTGPIASLAASLHARIDELVELGRRVATAEHRHDLLRTEIAELVWSGLERHGVRVARAAALEVWTPDIELNAQGLGVWLDKAA